jgi:hypothetical protein
VRQGSEMEGENDSDHNVSATEWLDVERV